MKHEEKIYSKQFRELVRHLNAPEKPVAAILHVNQAAALVTLAERIELLSANQKTPESLIRSLEPQLHNRTLLLSLPERGPNPFSSFSVTSSAIRPSAWSKVIFLPPFYIAFTPGLFEITKQHAMNTAAAALRRKSSLRFKF
jgi:hypothetical protein